MKAPEVRMFNSLAKTEFLRFYRRASSTLNRAIYFGLSLMLVYPAFLATTVMASDDASEEVPYAVECSEGKCKVDAATYKGWRAFHSICHTCHAQDAVGSTFAPNLLERMKSMNKERFLEIVMNGYEGQVGVMPGWKQDPNVSPRIDDLWSYLKARADGVLPTGKPGRLR